MALPQIQQARIIQAPGVFDYAMREGPRLAEAFTAGLAAGQRARDSKQRAKEVETARGDRLAERNQALLERFGADAVMDPESGTVDVTRSAGAMRERADVAALARQAGEAEAFGMSMADVPPEIRQMPEYNEGMARGLSTVKRDEMIGARAAERAAEILDRQKEIKKIEQQGLTERQQMGDSADFVRALLRPRGGAGAGSPTISMVERPDGTSVTRKFRTEEELQAFQDEQAKRGEAAGGSKDKEFTQAARDAIDEYDRLKNRGIASDLEFDSKGLPKVTPSRFLDTANDQVIDALRRKVEPQKKLTGRTPVPLFALPNMGANSVPTNVITR